MEEIKEERLTHRSRGRFLGCGTMLLGTVSITVGDAFNGSCIVAGGADILTRLAGARNGLDGVPSVGVLVVVVVMVAVEVTVGLVDGTTSNSGSACSGVRLGVSRGGADPSMVASVL